MTPQQQKQPTGIPQWLEQFLNSQGGMQGLLYQAGGIQGLLDLIQQQSQQPQFPERNPRGIRYGQDPTGLSTADQRIADPYGWWDYKQKAEAARPRKEFNPTVVQGVSKTGEQIPYSSLYQGDQNVVIPTMADLQAKYPFMDNPLVAKGLEPLVPYGAGGRPSPVNPYFDIPTQQAGASPYGSVIPDAEFEAWKKAGGLQGKTGREALQYLPESLKPKGTPEQLKQLQNLQSQYEIALKMNPGDPFLLQQAGLAREAFENAAYGRSLGALLSPASLEDRIMPQSALSRAPKPLSKYDYAGQYGYNTLGGGKWPGQGFFENVQQTLRSAGWDPTKGYGPQEEWDPLSSGAARTPEQQKMLNDLLYSISPQGGGVSMEQKRLVAQGLGPDGKRLPEAPDPFVGMQGAINRDAYVNDTLGGGFYGGLIPEEDAINVFGGRQIGGAHDPHFPTPQLKLNPMPGESKYDTYAGWASDQGAAFGTAPWAVDSQWGQAQGYDDPKRYKQPPAPGTAYPTPQFGGGTNTFGGTQGWGNTSRNGQNSGFGGASTQQQPMTFGASPWDNPWGMR